MGGMDIARWACGHITIDCASKDPTNTCVTIDQTMGTAGEAKQGSTSGHAALSPGKIPYFCNK